MGDVHYLPDRDQPDVVEGEVVSQRALALARYTAYKHDLVIVGRAVKTAVTHTATKSLARNLWYPVAGTAVMVRRWRDSHGNSRYERMMRQAELAGNPDLILEWESRDVAEKQRRHQRLMDWVKSPLVLARAFAIGIGSITALLLVIGLILAIANGNPKDTIGPITAFFQLISWVAWFLAAYGAVLLIILTVAVVAVLWQIGRAHTEPPAWIAPAAANDPTVRDLVPDESAILNALRNLNLAPLNKKFKEGWKPRWVLPTGRDGKGWRTQLELPASVNVEMINDKRAILAHNLVRLPVEVWPTEPKKQPGVLDLWVADQGVLTGPVDPYPLLVDGETDYFKGVPVGIDQRGSQVFGKLMASNYAIAGIMGSGKTALVLELLLGGMLDPIVELDVYVMAYNVDYDAMEPRLRNLVKGDEDEQIDMAMYALRELRADVTRKGKFLADMGGEETKLTRELALADPTMRPKITVFDECQELFRHEKYGEEAKQLAIKVMMKARKCGETLVWVTPAPSADSLPRDLAKTVSHRVCFAIGDHQGNDAILGTGAHRQGITATNLVAGEDIGTAMASGFSPRPGLLRTHHIRKEKGIDEITPIVQRALDLRRSEGIESAVRMSSEDQRDLLEDLSEVIGVEPVSAADLPARLRKLAPSWAPYGSLTGKQIVSQLQDRYKVKVPSTGNRWRLDPAAIHDALARLATADLDDE